MSAPSFAAQLAEFLADNRELVAKVAAGAAGYRFANLERVVQLYNQQVPR